MMPSNFHYKSRSDEFNRESPQINFNLSFSDIDMNTVSSYAFQDPSSFLMNRLERSRRFEDCLSKSAGSLEVSPVDQWTWDMAVSK